MDKNYKGINITGSGKFIEKTIDALEFIRRKSNEDYKKIIKYLKGIKQARRSGMILRKAIFNVNISSAYYSIEWYAGIIVHDVHHYYLHFIKGFKWKPKNFKKHEHLCFDEQIRFLKKAKAPDWMINHVKKSYEAGHWQYSKRHKLKY
ncbi:MAG: hypothetical protein AABX07_00670 [Nanoarchaeota archaeon]